MHVALFALSIAILSLYSSAVPLLSSRETVQNATKPSFFTKDLFVRPRSDNESSLRLLNPNARSHLPHNVSLSRSRRGSIIGAPWPGPANCDDYHFYCATESSCYDRNDRCPLNPGTAKCSAIDNQCLRSSEGTFLVRIGWASLISRDDERFL